MILSPLVKFCIYCLFIILSVNYLTKNRLDDNSKYLIIAVLIIPYLYIDTLTNFTNINEYDNESFSGSMSNIEKKENKKEQIKQPIITLSKEEEITNKNVDEEIKIKKQNTINEHFNSSSDTLSDEQIKKIINIIKKEKLIEKYDGAPSNASDSISNTSLSNNPDYQPLGENGDNYTNKWDQDYILLNTQKWAPTMKPTPVCKAEKECPVCPSLTSGYPISLKEFESSRKVTPPINVDLNQINN